MSRSAVGPSAPAPVPVARPGWASRLGVQERVLATVLLLAALAMAVAGGTLLLAQWTRALDRADNGITSDVAQFRTLAQGGLSAGPQPFADVTSLLQVAVQRQVPAQDQTYLALVDGRPRFVPSGRRPVELENEPDLIRRLAALPPDAPAVISSTSTDAGTIRYAAVQVQVAGSPAVGTYVVAFALGPSKTALLDAARLYAVVSLVLLLVVGVVGRLVSGRLLRPLRLLREAAQDITHNDLSLRIPVTGHDDVSELTRTVNDMLDRLQSAFETQQRFLDDAGHELRTPLTIIGGHLEVLDAADRGEVEATRSLVLDELDRMARLVDDLIVLAKARRPDFVRTAPVDLDDLLDSVLDKCVALGPRYWHVEAHSGRSVVADAQRLTQALLQLAHNAVRHTVEGQEIALGASVSKGAVWLWVRDTGPGVRPQDAGRIFERFGRGAQTSGRGDDGSGLGLAIVSAIAAAHGGKAGLESVAGRGATFTVSLPGAALLAREPFDATPTVPSAHGDRFVVDEVGGRTT